MSPINQHKNYKLSGENTFAYMGVDPSTPPQLVIESQDPTVYDFNFNIGTWWIERNPQKIFMLIDLGQGLATWAQLYPGLRSSI